MTEDMNLELENSTDQRFLELMNIINSMSGKTEERFKNMATAFKEATEKIRILEERIIALETKPVFVRKPSYSQSETIGKISDALAKAQSEICKQEIKGSGSCGQGTKKSTVFGDYYKASAGALSANGIAVKFDTTRDELGEDILRLIISHKESGEWFENVSSLYLDKTQLDAHGKPTKEIHQRRGFAITYTMKNMYRTAFGLPAENEEE